MSNSARMGILAFGHTYWEHVRAHRWGQPCGAHFLYKYLDHSAGFAQLGGSRATFPCSVFHSCQLIVAKKPLSSLEVLW